MCDPVSIISAGSAALSIGGQVASHKQGKKNAKAERAAAIAGYERDVSSLNLRGQQEQEASAQTKIQQQREYRSAKASALVAAEDAGVMGISADGLLNDLAIQQADRASATDTNLGWALRQLADEQTSSANTMKGRYNAAAPPSMASLLIGIGGTAASAYTGYKTRTDPDWSAA